MYLLDSERVELLAYLELVLYGPLSQGKGTLRVSLLSLNRLQHLRAVRLFTLRSHYR